MLCRALTAAASSAASAAAPLGSLEPPLPWLRAVQNHQLQQPARSGHSAGAQRCGTRIITVDTLNQPDPNRNAGKHGSVQSEVVDAHLEWLEEELLMAERDPKITNVIVQGHAPVLQPVRKRSSSGMLLDKGQNSPFWQVMKKHGVDLYLAGEVHDVTASRDETTVQISHGGIIGYQRYASFLVGTVYSDSIELNVKANSMAPMWQKKGPLWQLTRNRPAREVEIFDDYVQRGRLTIEKSGESPVFVDNDVGWLEFCPTSGSSCPPLSS